MNYDYEIEKRYHPENFEISTDDDSISEGYSFESEDDTEV